MAENRRGRDKRYYFTLGQMLLLGTAFTVTALVVFVLGIFIGKGIEARKMVRPEEPLIKLPVKPSNQGSVGTAVAPPKEELTFYETLTKAPQNQSTLEQREKEKATAKNVKREVKEAKPEDGKSVAPAVETSPGRNETQEPVKADIKPGKSEPNANDTVAERKLVEKKAAKTLAAAEPAKTVASAENSEQKDVPKTWSVQLNAFPDERSAKQLVDRLKNKGYNAVISEGRNKTKVWYRVRVGKYSSREEADKALENLKNRENFDKAFATSRP